MTADIGSSWDKAEVEDLGRRLKRLRMELAAAPEADRVEVQRCIATIEAMLPVYRQFVRFTEAISAAKPEV